MKKSLSLLLVGVLSVGLLAGCGKNSTEESADVSQAEESHTIGYVCQNMTNPYFSSICDGIKENAKDGDEVIILDSAVDINKE
ncbi:MAG: hypothetical protein PHC41_16110 [Lachnospiraceae bacterium]|nr:hypothetical protein [Lachnospiraceae bacterium]MDD3617714.1 hypothetical protein [Lachnospiraceae bacterium]